MPFKLFTRDAVAMSNMLAGASLSRLFLVGTSASQCVENGLYHRESLQRSRSLHRRRSRPGTFRSKVPDAVAALTFQLHRDRSRRIGRDRPDGAVQVLHHKDTHLMKQDFLIQIQSMLALASCSLSIGFTMIGTKLSLLNAAIRRGKVGGRTAQLLASGSRKIRVPKVRKTGVPHLFRP